MPMCLTHQSIQGHCFTAGESTYYEVRHTKVGALQCRAEHAIRLNHTERGFWYSVFIDVREVGMRMGAGRRRPALTANELPSGDNRLYLEPQGISFRCSLLLRRHKQLRCGPCHWVHTPDFWEDTCAIISIDAEELQVKVQRQDTISICIFVCNR